MLNGNPGDQMGDGCKGGVLTPPVLLGVGPVPFFLFFRSIFLQETCFLLNKEYFFELVEVSTPPSVPFSGGPAGGGGAAGPPGAGTAPTSWWPPRGGCTSCWWRTTSPSSISPSPCSSSSWLSMRCAFSGAGPALPRWGRRCWLARFVETWHKSGTTTPAQISHLVLSPTQNLTQPVPMPILNPYP